jgi:hypothetical protein
MKIEYDRVQSYYIYPDDSQVTGGYLGTNDGINQGLYIHTNKPLVNDQNQSILEYTFSNGPVQGVFASAADGEGVDIVFVGMYTPDHADYTGRYVDLDWPVLMGYGDEYYREYWEGSMSAVIGAAAGYRYGFAKKAGIYVCATINGQWAHAFSDDPNPKYNTIQAYRNIIDWHKAKTNGNPTIVFNTFASIYRPISQNIGDFYRRFRNRTNTGIQFSNPFSSVGLNTLQDEFGINTVIDRRTGSWKADVFTTAYGGYPFTKNALLDEMVAAGIHVVNGAGITGDQVVNRNSPYWNVEMQVNPNRDPDDPVYWDYVYRRPVPDDAIMVGSLDVEVYSVTTARAARDFPERAGYLHYTGYARYKKSPWSQYGSGVDIWATGNSIWSTGNGRINYEDRPDFRIGLLGPSYYINATPTLVAADIGYDAYGDSNRITTTNGTHVSAAQVVGTLACYLQFNRDATPAQAKQWILDNSININGYPTLYNPFYKNYPDIEINGREIHSRIYNK